MFNNERSTPAMQATSNNVFGLKHNFTTIYPEKKIPR